MSTFRSTSLLSCVIACALLSFMAHGSAAPRRVIISPVYGPDTWFSVTSRNTDVLTLHGAIPGLAPHSVTDDDTYKQRFVTTDGAFRVIHVLGKESETRHADGRTIHVRRPVTGTSRFSLAGIFASGASDPMDLVPLYPGHAVAVGDTWTPTAAVKTPFGTGTARYTFRVDDIETDRSGHMLARVTVSFVSTLVALTVYRGDATSATGTGWFLWDCTVNERRELHLRGIYTLLDGKAIARDVITDDDHLVAHRGHLRF